MSNLREQVGAPYGDDRRGWLRSAQMKVNMLPGEKEDIETAAAAFGVTPSEVAWAIIAEWCARHRGRSLVTLPGSAGAKRTLKKMGYNVEDMREV